MAYAFPLDGVMLTLTSSLHSCRLVAGHVFGRNTPTPADSFHLVGVANHGIAVDVNLWEEFVFLKLDMQQSCAP